MQAILRCAVHMRFVFSWSANETIHNVQHIDFTICLLWVWVSMLLFYFFFSCQTQPDFWKSESELNELKLYLYYALGLVWCCIDTAHFLFHWINNERARSRSHTHKCLNKLSNFNLNSNSPIYLRIQLRDFLIKYIPFVEFYTIHWNKSTFDIFFTI